MIIRLTAHPLGRQDLFLDAADREDVAPEGDLSGHGHVPADLGVRAQGDEGRGDGHAGRRPVLGDGALGDMDVEIVLLEEPVVDAEFPGVGPGIAQGGLGGFLHDFAQGTGQREVPLPLHLGRLDEEDLAAGLGPGDAGGDADLVLVEELVLEDLGRAEEGSRCSGT